MELLSAPLILGAWWTTAALSALNALALRHHVRVEERALEEAEIGAR